MRGGRLRGPKGDEEKLGFREALAFILAALGLVGPYIGIAVAAFILIFLLARLLG